MDDFAHLLLGYAVFRFLKLGEVNAGRLELAAILLGSILPDSLWAFGFASYAAAHTAAVYVSFALPLLPIERTRIAAAVFAASSFLHILADSFMHARATALFAPFSDFAIVGTFNYWEVWWAAPLYWLALLALLAISLWLEKEKSGKITAMV